jgi:hypothetical protein
LISPKNVVELRNVKTDKQKCGVLVYILEKAADDSSPSSYDFEKFDGRQIGQ